MMRLFDSGRNNPATPHYVMVLDRWEYGFRPPAHQPTPATFHRLPVRERMFCTIMGPSPRHAN